MRTIVKCYGGPPSVMQFIKAQKEIAGPEKIDKILMTLKEGTAQEREDLSNFDKQTDLFLP